MTGSFEAWLLQNRRHRTFNRERGVGAAASTRALSSPTYIPRLDEKAPLISFIQKKGNVYQCKPTHAKFASKTDVRGGTVHALPLDPPLSRVESSRVSRERDARSISNHRFNGCCRKRTLHYPLAPRTLCRPSPLLSSPLRQSHPNPNPCLPHQKFPAGVQVEPLGGRLAAAASISIFISISISIPRFIARIPCCCFCGFRWFNTFRCRCCCWRQCFDLRYGETAC